MATKRVVLYLRVSGLGQRDNYSLETQEQECRKYADEQRWQIVDVMHEVYTGTELERPMLSRVQEMANAGLVDTILVLDQDRFSRNPMHYTLLLYPLVEIGVEAWSVRDGQLKVDGGLEYLFAQIKGFAAKQEISQKVERTERGRRARVNNGNLLGSSPKPAYGYQWPEERRPDGRLWRARYVINEDEASVVRRIFGLVLAGQSLRGIAVQLNDENVPSPYANTENYNASGKWRHQTIGNIIRNEYYKGEAWAMINRRAPKQKGQRQGILIRDHEQAVLLPEGTVPALVSVADWDRAQRLLADRPVPARRAGNPEAVLLRGGLVRCGNCGRAMRISHRRNGNRYYQCNKMSQETGSCSKPSPSIKTDYVEEPVWRMVRAMLTNPYLIADRFDSAEQQQSERNLVEDLRGQHAAKVQKRSRLLRNLAELDEEDVRELKPELDRLAVERDQLAGKIAALEQRIASREGDRNRMLRLLDWARDEVRRVAEMTVEEKRAILLQLGVRVHVFPTGSTERFTIEIGAAKPKGEGLFSAIDFDNIAKPTTAQMRAFEEESTMENARGHDAMLVEEAVNGPGSADGSYSWDYWDDHVREAIAQHARVFGIEPVS